MRRLLDPIAAKVRKILSTPPTVLVFRARQLAILKFYQWFHRWNAVSVRAARAVRDIKLSTFSIFDDASPSRLQSARIEYSDAVDELIFEAEELIAGRFEIFGSRPANWPRPEWNADWRFSKKWPNLYFKEYRFYEEKEQPYDVKFPWELSRLHYLAPILMAALFDKDGRDKVSFCFNVLSDWNARNPLAHSVNWYPMEASVRLVVLSWLLDIVLLNERSVTGDSMRDCLKDMRLLLLEMLYAHAVFVWMNREVSAVNGNHFMANVVALMLAGSIFSGKVGEANGWTSYALRHFSKEVMSQYCADGVQFEKSCGYHKLVTELSVIGYLAAKRAGHSFPASVADRLRAALSYSKAITRPDGLATNFGDTDDACLIPFGITCPRSHAMLIAIGSSALNNALPRSARGRLSGLLSLLLVPDVEIQEETREKALKYFDDGGYVIVRNAQSFHFMADVGEVGMRGLGGHGHNDLLSFELTIGGRAFVVDRGCSTYTGDLQKKDMFRKSASHSTVIWCGQEMAELLGAWRIAPHAVPGPVVVTDERSHVVVDVSHAGFARFSSGGVVSRRFEVMPQEEKVVIRDRMSASEGIMESIFHFHPDVKLTEVGSRQVRLLRDDVHVEFSVSAGDLRVSDHLHSEGYGIEALAKTIHVSLNLAQANCLTAVIQRRG